MKLEIREGRDLQSSEGRGQAERAFQDGETAEVKRRASQHRRQAHNRTAHAPRWEERKQEGDGWCLWLRVLRGRQRGGYTGNGKSFGIRAAESSLMLVEFQKDPLGVLCR